MRERVARKSANHLISRPGDGSVLSVSIQPRTDGGWVVTLHDITERERLNARLVEQNTLLQQREEELAAQNARFDAAIGNMSQGMCLYDAEQRIVFANGRYAEIYRADPRAGEAGHDACARSSRLASPTAPMAEATERSSFATVWSASADARRRSSS